MILMENVNKSFEDRAIFKDFNLQISKGSFVVISGNSGRGKTTLLNMMGGLEKPDSGNIVVDGHNISEKRIKNKFFEESVGFLFQNFALIENKTVQQNLEIIQKSGRSEISIKEALEKVGLAGTEKQKVYKLSGGEQQRIALARLMVKKCNLILADEPTGSLDEKNSDMVMEILRDLNKMGKTIVLVTHSRKIVEEAEFVVKI